MSKKSIRKKYKGGYTWEGGKLYQTGNWLKRYFKLKTTKRKHKGYEV